MSDFQMEKLNSDNYRQWCSRIKSVLVLKTAWQAVNPGFGEEPTPAQINIDNIAMATIQLSVDNQTLKNIQNLPSARQMWEALTIIHTTYDVWHGTEMLYEYVNLKMKSGEKMTDYLDRRSDLYDNVVDAGHELNEKAKISFILKGLPKEYEAISRTLRSGEGNDPGDLVMTKVVAKLRAEERKIVKAESEE
jgi:hypothetical protein